MSATRTMQRECGSLNWTKVGLKFDDVRKLPGIYDTFKLD